MVNNHLISHNENMRKYEYFKDKSLQNGCTPARQRGAALSNPCFNGRNDCYVLLSRFQEMPSETPSGLAYRMRAAPRSLVSQSVSWEVTGRSSAKENLDPIGYLNPIDVEYRSAYFLTQQTGKQW